MPALTESFVVQRPTAAAGSSGGDRLVHSQLVLVGIVCNLCVL